jgi:glycosyltransferase involved in cell wall biosynthesis
MQPLVSVIMPTANRRRFVARAIEQFRAQTYAEKQLIIVEDGGDDCSDLCGSSRIIHLRARLYGAANKRRLSIGAKRNIACAAASGEIIAHFDDDDWQAPRRLEAQVAALQNADLCGLSRLVFYDGAEAWLYRSLRNPWLAGSSLAYRKTLWYACGGFADVSNGEDVAFLDAARGARIAKLEDESLHVLMLHGANSVPRVKDVQWTQYDAAAVRGWMAHEQALQEIR